MTENKVLTEPPLAGHNYGAISYQFGTVDAWKPPFSWNDYDGGNGVSHARCVKAARRFPESQG